jgi:voltage-dependent calcium channel L type alpha-1D
MSYEDAIIQAKYHSGGGLSLSSLRAFRVLRPLKAVTSIKGLQVLVLSVLTSLPLLKDTIIVLFSFFLIFAIAST